MVPDGERYLNFGAGNPAPGWLNVAASPHLLATPFVPRLAATPFGARYQPVRSQPGSRPEGYVYPP